MLARLPAYLAAFLFFALMPHLALAQLSWNLTNVSNQTLEFETFEPVRGTWKLQTIYPNQPVNYSMKSQTAKFRISTENRGYVEYQVQAGGRYTLGWDKAKAVWDLKRAATAAPAANAPPPIVKPSWGIRNGSNQNLTFDTFDPSRGSWKEQQIYPNEVKTYTFNPGISEGKFRIRTDGRGYVEYAVRAGWKYNIVWDDNKGTWDLRTLQRGS
jgi:hypothetical protein